MDFSKYKATAEKCGHIIAVYVEGDPMCLWMHMYLDCRNGQMTCDSDIGMFACMMPIKADLFSRWLRKADWLLRKCVKPNEMEFRLNESIDCLREMADDEDLDMEELNDVIYENDYTQDAESWMTALQLIADQKGFELPDEWYDCVIRCYTPQQKRFAEICRDVIAPEVERVMQE